MDTKSGSDLQIMTIVRGKKTENKNGNKDWMIENKTIQSKKNKRSVHTYNEIGIERENTKLLSNGKKSGFLI